jgi:putative transposase
MASSVECLQYHLVFSTKYRYNFLNTKIACCLRDFFLRKQDVYKYKIISLAIEPNHVHFLLQIPNSQFDLNKLVKQLKGGSSLFIRKRFGYLTKYPNLWTPSHFLASSGSVSSETIKQYIDNQGIEEKEIIQRTFKYKVLTPTRSKLSTIKQYFEECRASKGRSTTPSSIYQDFTRVSNTRKKSKQLGLYIRAQNSKIFKSTSKLAKYWWKLPGSSTQEPILLGLQGRNIPDDAEIRDSFLREVKKNGKKELFAFLVVQQERVVKRPVCFKALANDLGINHTVTSVLLDNEKVKRITFYGKKFKELLYKRKKRQKQLRQSIAIKDKKASKKQLNPTSYSNKIKQELQNIINCIVKQAKDNDCAITIGYPYNLKHAFKKKNKKSNKRTRAKSVGFCYNDLIDRLILKATLACVPVIVVPEHYTSQKCFKCKKIEKGNRKGQEYSCECGYKKQADINGCSNIYCNGVVLLSTSHSAYNSDVEWFSRFSEVEEVQSSARNMNKQNIPHDSVLLCESGDGILEQDQHANLVGRPTTLVVGI